MKTRDYLLLNAFSLNMLNASCNVHFELTTVEHARELLSNGFISAIGHDSTALIVSKLLGMPVTTNRLNVELGFGDYAVVAQYHGPRLDVGVTELPPGARIEFWIVTVDPTDTVPF